MFNKINILVIIVAFVFSLGCGNRTGKASGDGPFVPSKLALNTSISNSTYGYNIKVNNVASGFNSQEGANDSINAMVFDNTSNKLIIGGNFTKYNGVDVAHIARLNSDGSLDTSFVGQLTCNVFSLSTNGSILNVGCMNNNASYHMYNGISSIVKGLVPMNLNNGSLNTNMNNNYLGIDIASLNRIENIFPTTFGSILLGRFNAWGSTVKTNIVAINSNGEANTSFLQNLSIGNSNEWVNAMNTNSANNYLVGGNFTTVNRVPKNYLALINSSTGTLDNTFPSANLQITGPVNNITKLSSGKLMIGLSTYSLIEKIHKGILVLNADGSLDSTFNTNTTATTKFITGTKVTTIYNEGSSVLIGGIFSKYNDITRYYFARLSTNGDLSTSCDVGNLFSDGEIKSIDKDQNGNIYIGGSFYIFNSGDKTVRSNIIKLDSNCALDLG